MMRTCIPLVCVMLYVLGAYGLANDAAMASEWTDSTFHPVDSNVFDSARYDRATRTLTLLFRSGEAYDYLNVSRRTWLTFMRVTRKGSFFNAHIRRGYDYRLAGYAP